MSMKARMNRRNFLKVGSVAASWPLLSQLIHFYNVNAIAAPDVEKHFFVLITVTGGMDVTLGLDPRTHKDGSDQKDIFLEYTEDDILGEGNIRLGPSAESLLEYANDISIINGINMRRDAGHESLREYLASGSGSGGHAVLPVEIAATTKSGPMGVVINEFVPSGKRKIIMTQTSELLDSSDANGDLLKVLGLMVGDDDASFTKAINGLISSKEPLAVFKNALQSFGELEDEMKDAVAAALSFSSGLSQQAVLQVSGFSNGVDLDTHSNHEGRHLNSQKSIWDQVAGIFSVFKQVEYKQKSLFDHTTFMVVTEFSRTPWLNSAKGKDHNSYTNSVLLAGKGIAGGNMIGGSHVIKRNAARPARHLGTPIDYKNGNLVLKRENSNKDVGLIFPENVARTVAKLFGDPKDFSSVSLSDIKPIPGILK